MSNKKDFKQQTPIIKNRKVNFDYEILETFTAGISLTGTEIKSIRLGKASLVDSYCLVDSKGVKMVQSYVARYDEGSYNNHEERRERQLLLTKREIRHLELESKNVGITIVPLKMFINSKGFCKVEIALVKGKKTYDKRQTIKNRESAIELNRIMKSY